MLSKRIDNEIQKIVDSKSGNKATGAASGATKGAFEATKDVLKWLMLMRSGKRLQKEMQIS